MTLPFSNSPSYNVQFNWVLQLSSESTVVVQTLWRYIFFPVLVPCCLQKNIKFLFKRGLSLFLTPSTAVEKANKAWNSLTENTPNVYGRRHKSVFPCELSGDNCDGDNGDEAYRCCAVPSHLWDFSGAPTAPNGDYAVSVPSFSADFCHFSYIFSLFLP